MENHPIWQWAFNAVATGLVALGSWIMREQGRKIEDLQRRFSDHRVEIAGKYATRAEILAMLEEIRDGMLRIEDKVDGR